MQPTLKTPPLQSAWPAMPNGGAGVETEERVPRRLRGAGDRKDIFALVKGNMADSSLIQPPLLVWPESLLGTTENFWNCVNSTTETIQQELDPSRAQDLLLLAGQIESDFPAMGRAVSYYKSLVDAGRPRKSYERLQFVEDGPQASARVGDVRIGQRPAPPRPHKLEVVFHHGGG